MRTPLLLACISFAALSGSGQVSTGTEHWVTFMENLDLQFNEPPSFHLVLSSETGATGEVSFPATGFAIPFSIPAGADVVVDLPVNNYYADGDEALFNFGLRVTSDAPISVYAYHDRLYFSEASLVLPTTMLSADYIVLAHEDQDAISPSEFVALATADGTEVEIIPSVLTAGFRPPGVPFSVVLDAGQSIQIQASGDLSGSQVRSLDMQKPIAVFAGARQARVNCPGGGADDHLYNQVYPADRWGRDFIVVPYLGRNGDEVRVLAAEDGTTVTVSGTPYTLDAGEKVSFNATAPVRILANGPVAVGQFNDSQTCNGASGDPAYLFVPPLSFTDHRVLWNARNSDGTPEHFVNIHGNTITGVGAIFLDGVDISSYFQPVPNVPGHWYLQRSISEGSHELVSEKPFQAVAYDLGDYNSCTYALGFENTVNTGIEEGHRHESNTPIIRAGEAWWPRWNAVGTEELRIMDLSGRLVLRTRLQVGAQVPTEALGSGVYLYDRMAAGQRISSGRLVVR